MSASIDRVDVLVTDSDASQPELSRLSEHMEVVVV